MVLGSWFLVLGSWLREAGYEAKTQRRGVEKTDIGTQRRKDAELGRVFGHAKAQRRKDAELRRRILARRGVETRSWEGCFFSRRDVKTLGCKRRVIGARKDAKAQSLMDVYFSQRHRGARAKARSWEGYLGTQRHRGASAET